MKGAHPCAHLLERLNAVMNLEIQVNLLGINGPTSPFLRASGKKAGIAGMFNSPSS
jgi:hypothetical protein